MSNLIKKRTFEVRPEEHKLAAPSPETHKVPLNGKFGTKIKIISHIELALVATVLDFTSDD
jgi:hypothetical protein